MPQQCMTKRDGSKARASAICISLRQLPQAVAQVPEKAAGLWLFLQQNPVTSKVCPGNVRARVKAKAGFGVKS